MKKKKYNLLFAIQDLGLSLAFEEYKRLLNSSISDNRKARAFLTHYGRVVNYKLPCYELGHEKSYMDYLGLKTHEVLKDIRRRCWELIDIE